jgi:hypothetical protein
VRRRFNVGVAAYQLSNSKLGVIARLDRAIQYSRGASA